MGAKQRVGVNISILNIMQCRLCSVSTFLQWLSTSFLTVDGILWKAEPPRIFRLVRSTDVRFRHWWNKLHNLNARMNPFTVVTTTYCWALQYYYQLKVGLKRWTNHVSYHYIGPIKYGRPIYRMFVKCYPSSFILKQRASRMLWSEIQKLHINRAFTSSDWLLLTSQTITSDYFISLV